MLWTVLRAPSAVWTSETPSWMLRWFCARPRIWPRIFSEMARPAASSAARLIRYPLDRRSIDCDTDSETWVRFRCALNASTLFWMRRDMRSLLEVVPGRLHATAYRGTHRPLGQPG